MVKEPQCDASSGTAMKKAGVIPAARGEWRCHLARAIRIGIAVDRALFDYIQQQVTSLKGLHKGAAREQLSRATRLRLAPGVVREEAMAFAEQTAGNLQRLGLDQADALGHGVALDLTYSYLSGALPLPAWERGMTLLEKAELLTAWPALDLGTVERMFLGEDLLPDERIILVLEALGEGRTARMRFDVELAGHVAPLLNAWMERAPHPAPGTGFN